MSRDERPARTGRISRRRFLGGLSVTAVGLGLAGVASRLGESASAGRKRVRFAVIGDSGTGFDAQYAVAEQMRLEHARKPFDFVLMLGDNAYEDGSQIHFEAKFERPYRPLLDAGLEFHAVLGNHDIIAGREDQLAYPLFHMNGSRYRNLQFGGRLLELFLLDSNDPDDLQVAWLDAVLGVSTARWRIVALHHPLYTAGTAYAPYERLIRKVGPLLVKHQVPVVFSGHEHLYQRLLLQNGTQFFISGGAGEHREGELDYGSPLLAKGYDTGSHFMTVDVRKKAIKYAAIAADGTVIDAGRLKRSAFAEASLALGA